MDDRGGEEEADFFDGCGRIHLAKGGAIEIEKSRKVRSILVNRAKKKLAMFTVFNLLRLFLGKYVNTHDT